MNPFDQPDPSAPPIRPSGAADTNWISDFLRERWGASTIVVHDEVIDAGLGWDRELLRTFACKSKRCVRIPGRAEKHT